MLLFLLRNQCFISEEHVNFNPPTFGFFSLNSISCNLLIGVGGTLLSSSSFWDSSGLKIISD